MTQGAGLEYSLQAALTLSRLKPELHACFGVQSSMECSLKAVLQTRPRNLSLVILKKLLTLSEPHTAQSFTGETPVAR